MFFELSFFLSSSSFVERKTRWWSLRNWDAGRLHGQRINTCYISFCYCTENKPLVFCGFAQIWVLEKWAAILLSTEEYWWGHYKGRVDTDFLNYSKQLKLLQMLSASPRLYSTWHIYHFCRYSRFWQPPHLNADLVHTLPSLDSVFNLQHYISLHVQNPQ